MFDLSVSAGALQCFFPGVWEISQEIWGVKILRFPGNLCQDLENFFYISKDFGGTNVYHFDAKNALVN